jgi:hypothetical protein
MAREEKPVATDEEDEQGATQGSSCPVCGVKLSAYNPGPNCWQHTIGNPWRGPSAKPRYD